MAEPHRSELLDLAAQGTAALLTGCAGHFSGSGKGLLLDKANDYFGPKIVSQWSAFLRSQPPDRQRNLIEELATLLATEARREVTATIRRLVPLANPQDEAILIEYLTFIPGRVKLGLVSEPSSGRRKLPDHWALESDQSLADLLGLSRRGSASPSNSAPAGDSGLLSGAGPKSTLPMPSPLAPLSPKRHAEPEASARRSHEAAVAKPAPLPGQKVGALDTSPKRRSEPEASARRSHEAAVAKPPSPPQEVKPESVTPPPPSKPLDLAEMNRRAKAQMAKKRKEIGRASREIVDKRRLAQTEQLRVALALQVERNAWKEALKTIANLLKIDPRDPDALETKAFIEEQMATGAEDAGGEVRVFTGHQGWVNCAAFFPDGRRLLTVSGGLRVGGHLKEEIDRGMRIWDYHTGQVLRHFAGLTLIINSVALTPDGQAILVGGRDGDIYLWDADTGKIIRRFETALRFVTSLTISPDGRRALCGSDDKYLRLWDVTTGRRLNSFLGHHKPISSVAYSKDGKRALTGSMDKTMRLWDLETGQELRVYKGHSKAVLAVAFSPDNRLALTGSLGSSIRLWDVRTGKDVHRLDGHSDAVHSVTFSPDGRWGLSGSSDKTVRLWDIETGKEVRRYEGHTDDIRCVLFSPDGKLALSASRDTTVRLWRVPPPPPTPSPAAIGQGEAAASGQTAAAPG